MAFLDKVFAIVILFVISFVFIVGGLVNNEINSSFRDKFPTDNIYINETLDKQAEITSNFDTMFLMLFFGVNIVILILAYLLPTSPIMTAITFLSMLMTLLITPVLTNAYMEFAAGIDLINVETTFPMMTFIFQYYPLFFLVFMASLFVILVAKFQQGGSVNE